METLAYLHLVLAHQEFNQQPESEKTSKPNNLGASWDKDAWDEIFASQPTRKQTAHVRGNRESGIGNRESGI